MTTTLDPSRYTSLRAQAKTLDEEDSLRHTRDGFRIPSKVAVKRKTLAKGSSTSQDPDETTPSTYLCGNSLGVQPKITKDRIETFLETWGNQGVQGHFKPLDDSELPIWLDADARAAKLMAPIVGADEQEVAVMQTLTGNLHLLMSAFYRPDSKGRHKIILESKAFPSDHFAVMSQIRLHGLSPETSMVTIQSPSAEDPLISTQDIQSVISEHAADAALILLPGIQYYTGQLFDIPTITAFAHKHGIFVIWDLAHAAGNVPLSLHDWDVDAAVWCTYKYLNGGPGSMGGAFIHSKHSLETPATSTTPNSVSENKGHESRLLGWWGNNKATRFIMDTKFDPGKGAAGFQISNPSVLDITAVCASLELFEQAGGMIPLRQKSKKLTAFLETCLSSLSDETKEYFRIITPSDPEQRGSQLSLLLLGDGLLDPTMDGLVERSIIVDERRPSVIRVAPAPIYNNFGDCIDFAVGFEESLLAAVKAK